MSRPPGRYPQLEPTLNALRAGPKTSRQLAEALGVGLRGVENMMPRYEARGAVERVGYERFVFNGRRPNIVGYRTLWAVKGTGAQQEEREIDRLRRENTDLRRALGLEDVDQVVLNLRAALNMPPQRVRLVQMLYAARGAWVPMSTIIDRIIDPLNRHADADNTVRVQIHGIRRVLGHDAVAVESSAYRLSEEAIQKITDLLDWNREAA